MRTGDDDDAIQKLTLSTAIAKKLGEKIRQVLTQVRKDVRQQIEQEAAPKTADHVPTAVQRPTGRERLL